MLKVYDPEIIASSDRVVLNKKVLLAFTQIFKTYSCHFGL